MYYIPERGMAHVNNTTVINQHNYYSKIIASDSNVEGVTHS